MGTQHSTLNTHNSKGVALVMVLWVTTILSVIALEFSFTMRTEVNIARNFKEETELYAMAEGGVQRAIIDLIFKHDSRIQNFRKTLKTEEVPPEQKEWVTDGRPYPLSFDQGKCEIRIMSEGGKVNINTASERALRKIIGQLGLQGEARDVVVDSILDWRDKDDFYRINGAENEYYQSLKVPYDCKNGNLDTIEELLLVRGVTPELFYGKKEMKKEGKEGEEGEEGEEGPAPSPAGMKDIFSVYASGERIDINSATIPVLRTVLGIPKEVAESIIKAREEKPLTQADFLRRVPEFGPFMADATNLIAFQSAVPYYTIEVKATKGEGKSVRGVKAVVKIDPTKKEHKVLQWVDTLL